MVAGGIGLSRVPVALGAVVGAAVVAGAVVLAESAWDVDAA
jgi:hypothetical protein